MANYYVDPTGGNGAGTIGDPWNNIAGHTAVLVAGDTVYLRGNVGSYLVYNESTINISADGTSGNPITITPYSNEQVEIRVGDGYLIFVLTGDYITLDGKDQLFLNKNFHTYGIMSISGQHCEVKDTELANILGGGSDGCIWNTGDYNTFDGLTIHDCKKSNTDDMGGVYNFGSNHAIIRNCTFYNMYGDGAGADYVAGPGGDYLVEDCTFYATDGTIDPNCTENGLDFKMNLSTAGQLIIRRCTFYGYTSCDGTEGGTGDMQGAAINLHYECDDIIIEDCEFYDCTQGIYGNCTDSDSTVIRNNRFYNFHNAAQDPGAAATGSLRLCYLGGAGIQFYNNTVYDLPEDGLIFSIGAAGYVRNNIFCSVDGDFDDAEVGITYEYNCWYDCADPISGTGDVTADPLFANASAGDFTLLEGSPCIDAGMDVGLPYEGAAPDMGAMEGAEAPPAETGVAFRSLTTQGGTEGASVVHAAPAGLTDDDILVLFLYKENDGAVSYPSGFTEVGSIVAADSSFWLYVAWKRAATESGTYTASWTGSVWRYSILAAYSGAVTTGDPNDATPTTVASGVQNNQITCPSITTTEDGVLVIPFGADFDYALNGTAALTGYTVREDERVCVIADAEKVTAGATGTLTYTHTQGSSQTAAITIALTPETGGGPVTGTYYVATTGNDGAAGTEAAPWATVQHAADTAIAGDVVVFEDGTWVIDTLLEFDTNSGTSGDPITFVARNAGSVKWQASGLEKLIHITVDFLVFDGIVFQGDTAVDPAYRLIEVFQGDDFTMQNCEVYDTNGHCVLCWYSWRPTFTDSIFHMERTRVQAGDCEGLAISCYGKATVTDCTFYHNAHTGLMISECGEAEITGCESYDNDSHCIDLGDEGMSSPTAVNVTIDDCDLHDAGGNGRTDPGTKSGVLAKGGSQNVTITRCRIYRCSGGGLQLQHEALGPFYVYNNTLYDNLEDENDNYGDLALTQYLADNSPTITFKNNIIYHTKDDYSLKSLMDGWGIAETADWDYNLWYDGSLTYPEDMSRNGASYGTYAAYAAVFEGNSIFSEDPLFVDPDNGDFTLQAGSPAILAGVDVGLPFDGATPDMGAEPYTAAPPVTNTYYVDPTGADGDGAIGTPWNNISGHAAALVAGDVMYLRGNVGSAQVYAESQIDIAVSGEAGNVITITPYLTEEVEIRTGAGDLIFNITGDYITIDGKDHMTLNKNDTTFGAVSITGDHVTLQDMEIENTVGGTSYGMISNTGDYAVFDGLTIHDGWRTNDTSLAGIFVNGASYVTVQNCTIYDMCGDGVYIAKAAGVGGDYLIENCTFYTKIGNASVGGIACQINDAEQLVIRDCVFQGFDSCDGTTGGLANTQGAAISISHDADNFLIEDCGLYDCTQGIYCNAPTVIGGVIRTNSFYDFHDAGDDAAAAAAGTLRLAYLRGANLKFYNNVAYNVPVRGLVFDESGEVTVRNNIFLDCGTLEGEEGAGIVANHNCWSSCDETLVGAGDVTDSPLLTDAVAGDFTLQSSSPCIDAGVYVGLSYYGAAPDMGAYEYEGEVEHKGPIFGRLFHMRNHPLWRM